MSITLSSINYESRSNSNSDGENAQSSTEIYTDVGYTASENKLNCEKNESITMIPKIKEMAQDAQNSDKSNFNKKLVDNNTECQKLKAFSSQTIRDNLEISSDEEDKCAVTTAAQTPSSSLLQITSIDRFFNRKRGRPPKNRFVEFYKNKYQNPQAIFTSFKLEKQTSVVDASTTVNEDSIKFSLQALKETDDPVNTYPGQEPLGNHIPQRRRWHRVTTRNVKSIETECKLHNSHVEFDDTKDGINGKCTGANDKSCSTNRNKILSNQSRNKNKIKQIEVQDLTHMAKKAKTCSSSDNVTVVCATGTYFPKNSNSGSIYEEKNFTSMESERLQLSNALNENIVAQDLSVRGASPLKVDSCTPSPSLAMSPFILPQIYNVFQMQQQLLLFCQQMALLTPATLPYIDHKTSENSQQLLSNKADADTCPPLSMKSAEIDIFHKKDLIINLPKSKSFAKTKDTCSPKIKRKTLNTKKSCAKANEHYKSFEAPVNCSNTVKIEKTQYNENSEHAPAGYLRFRFNEDCGYDKCGYRQHQSHFHCGRSDCQYSFCDKTRFVQHTARHERLDSLMGSDFQQYRANMKCNFVKCPYNLNDSTDSLNERKSSHFHCLKCEFVCVDTNKVVAHRRFHSKMEFVRFAGFRKVSNNENCGIESKITDVIEYTKNTKTFKNLELPLFAEPIDNTKTTFDIMPTAHCPYAMRHSHYHCLVCNCSVLSRSQLLAHKHRTTQIFNYSLPPQAATDLTSASTLAESVTEPQNLTLIDS